MLINKVLKKSVCSEFGIEPGDELIEINGKTPDCLDYIFYNSEESFTLTVKKINGEIIDFVIEKDQDEDLGLEFSDFEIKPKSCKNRCIFCFVDQLPKKLRKPLYFKDDDYRLSFISGNYITLTNITQNDIDRIIAQRISPLYFSVHSLNKDIRRTLLGNKDFDKTEEIIEKFSKNGIIMHCQIVMCPCYNDGKDLIDSINGLSQYYPYVKTLAVVPVGLTKFREKLTPIKPVDTDLANLTIKNVEELQQKFLKKFNDPFVYLSDEFYVKAQINYPSYEFYGEFEQIENGVGLLAKFEQEFIIALDSAKSKKRNKKYCIITGMSSYNFIKKLIGKYAEKFDNIPDVLGIENNFFGTTVTVSGLITATDIITQFNNKKYDKVLLPKCMTKEFEEVFLDDLTAADLERAIDNKISLIDCDGEKLLNTLVS